MHQRKDWKVNPKIEKILVVVRDRKVREVNATYSGLPAGRKVRLEVLRLGATLGSTIDEGTVKTSGMIYLSSDKSHTTLEFWTDERMALRLVSEEGTEDCYTIFHVRPKCADGLLYLLWWFNPLNWLRYYVLDDHKYRVNICSTRLD
ncbi:MAG: hypothetical protein ABI758_03835 [Candidatus Woesebacteria bacterium]